MMLVRIIATVIIFLVVGFDSTQGETEGSLLSKCDYYGSNKTISDILKNADSGYVLQLNDIMKHAPIMKHGPYGAATLELTGRNLFSGENNISISLRVVVVENQNTVRERAELHNQVSFLMDYADRPPGLGYFGVDRSRCNIIPAVLPGIEYWVFFNDDRISLFEPVSETSQLRAWIDYFIESRYGAK